MKCKKCGFENPEESNFCSQCGSTLKTVCPKCGKEVRPEDSYCGGCGFQLSKDVKNTFKLSAENFKIPQFSPSTMKALSIVLIIASFALFFFGTKEAGWFQDQIIGYEICSLVLFLLGAYLFNPSWFTKKKALGVVLIIIGLIIFLINVLCSGTSGYRIKYFKFRKIELEEIAFSFFLLATLIIIGIGLIKKADNETTTNLTENLIPNDGKVHFKTKIDGKGFALAAFVSYIGLPVRIILSLFQIVFLVEGFSSELGFAIFLLACAVFCQIIALYGLYQFAHYSFASLMIDYSIGLLCNICVIIGYIIMKIDLPIFLYNACSICLEIYLMVYFYRRKDSYSSNPNKTRLEQKEETQND